MPDYKNDIECYGQRIINELDEPDKYGVYVRSDGKRKHLDIYDRQACYTKCSVSAPTWYDLFVSVQSVWTMHVFMKRGF